MATAISPPRVRPRDRAAILTGLGVVTTVAWLYVVLDASRMSHMPAMDVMMQARPWTATEFGFRLAMWAAMMVAMMTPTAAPMTLVYAAVARKASDQGRPLAPAFVFVAGYVAVWALFSVAATAAQQSLDQLALLSPTMVSKSPLLGSALLIAAGVYQLTPVKRACLEHCRAPAHFFAQHWRAGFGGAFRMGSRLGAYCLGCCWVLMGLLFVGGVMSLLWIAAIATFVLLEKIIPFGEVGGRIVGVIMILIGIVGLAI